MKSNNNLHSETQRPHKRSHKWEIITLIIGTLAWTLATSTTAHAFQVCARNCGIDAICLASVVTCETKINAYNAYTDQMGLGNQLHALPAVYKEILRTKYPQANFNNYRFAFSDRQPAGNATTDCNKTYFNSQDYVNRLSSADANPQYFWILHEVTHVEQCTAAGGREAYAKRWWDEMDRAMAARGLSINFNQSIQQIVAQMGTIFAQVHDMMPMENAATAKANIVLAELTDCCIDNASKPMFPLKVTAINDQLDAGSQAHLLTATVENGDSPFTSTWRIKSPGDVSYVNQPQNSITGLRLHWMPKKDPTKAVVVTRDTPLVRTITSSWTFDIEVDVAQEATSLDHQKFSRTITVSDVSTIRKESTGPTLPKKLVPVQPPNMPSLPSAGPQTPKLP